MLQLFWIQGDLIQMNIKFGDENMLICAIKITHDATIALANDNELVFSIELEKINNNPRFSHLTSISEIEAVLNDYGYSLKDIDVWLIDGWADIDGREGENKILFDGTFYCINNYQNKYKGLLENTVCVFNQEPFGEYYSFSHVYAHLCASYFTSPFAAQKENSYVLMFDGGTKPTLYYYDAESKTFSLCMEMVKLGGDIYPGLASRFEEFSYTRRIKNGVKTFTHHFAGTVMAYIALGKVDYEILDYCKQIYNNVISDDNNLANSWKENRLFEDLVCGKFQTDKSDKDILRTFHEFLQSEMCKMLKKAVCECDSKCKNICFAGGSMLNIKWNTAIRELGLFDQIYAPPFINDTGNAIGQICACNLTRGIGYLKWSTYLGPSLKNKKMESGWKEYPFDLEKIVDVIASGEPVIILNNRSELGPRALGNRSIIADARSIDMKKFLNEIKMRQEYRPVAPICLEEDASEYFNPGTPDKFMLFEHKCTPFAQKEIPAIMHIDGSARLQTISQTDNELMYSILKEYKRQTGISVLCNTSANGKGTGFFPDVFSAQKWGKCNYILSDSMIYEKIEKRKF